MRHNASSAREYDKKIDFASPDARGSARRTASHRYLPNDGKTAAAEPAREAAGAGYFTASDFKARWWPAPDSWQ